MTRAQEHSSGRTLIAVRTWNLVTALAVAGSLVALAGCSTSGEEARPPKSSPSQTVGSSPPKQRDNPDAQAVLANYDHFWDAVTAAYAQASVAGTSLEKFAVSEARTKTEHEVKALAKRGFVATGKPNRSPVITKIDMSKKVPSATIRDCIDTASWKLVDRKTRAVVQLPEERRTKFVSNVTAERWKGHWVILRSKSEDQGC